VLILGVVGAVVLGSAYLVTDSIARRVNAQASGTAIKPASTKVLSVRRAPETLSTVTRLGLVRRALSKATQQLPDESCLGVNWLGTSLTSIREEKAFIPASTQKIVTASVALENLGADYRFTTSVLATGFSSGVAQDLYFLGGGDPVIVRKEYVATEKFPTFNGTSLEALADSLVSAGLKSVNGAIVGVDSRYDQIRFLDAWPTSFNAVEAGPLGALVVNDGAVVGEPMKPDNPAIAAATELRTLLAARGVYVAQESRYEQVVPNNAAQIAFIQSEPLKSIVKEMLVNSDNNTAELLVKELGFVKKNSGTTSAGLAVVQDQLASWKIPNGSTIADGSGLSSNNRTTCANLMFLLARFEADFPDLMAVAAQTGTLRSVFEGTPMADRLVGKTGTLTDIKALAGYLPLQGNSPVRFTLIMNRNGIDNQSEYRPIWNTLGAALSQARVSPTAQQLLP
jgi:serine-type D-Ala-D-Ala carboxypeptidase/endopeptidase (penicillin-binding protein 4)